MFKSLFVRIVVSSFFGCIAMAMTGCNTVKGCMEYTRGTECLQRSEYEQAITYLEKAVEYDGTVCDFHVNLTCAYIAAGQIEKAWLESRRALHCSSSNYTMAFFNFKNLYQAYVVERGFDKPGLTEAEVLAGIGGEGPDDEIIIEDSKILLFGLSGFVFRNGQLVTVHLASSIQ